MPKEFPVEILHERKIVPGAGGFQAELSISLSFLVIGGLSLRRRSPPQDKKVEREKDGEFRHLDYNLLCTKLCSGLKAGVSSWTLSHGYLQNAQKKHAFMGNRGGRDVLRVKR